MILISLEITIQIFDMGGALIQKRASFSDDSIFAASRSNFINRIAWELLTETNISSITAVDFERDNVIAAYAAKNNITTNLLISPRGKTNELNQIRMNTFINILEGNPLAENTLYLITKTNPLSPLLPYLIAEDARIFDLDEYYGFSVITSISALSGRDFNDIVITVAEITDDYWSYGTNHTMGYIAVPDTEFNRYAIQKAKYVESAFEKLSIIGYRIDDAYSVLVIETIRNKDLKDFEYPYPFYIRFTLPRTNEGV
ncbi:MAG: hypothetical protein FWG21_00145 [Oscillospiraceae bacterium]|nr:hypothetical protein [Oscillospiraceae bacterium]